MKLLISLLILASCSNSIIQKKLTRKEQDAIYIKQLQKIRPLMVSDDFPYMGCEEKGSFEVMKDSQPDLEFWKTFGLLELREKGLAAKANIMALKYVEVGGKHKFSANYYSCTRVNDLKIVGEVGMCKPTEERVFKIKYGLDESRAVGEEIIRQVVRLYGIDKYYKTFSVGDIKYSYTNKELSTVAKFFECY